MDIKLCLQLFLLLASIAPPVISARDLFHIHKSPRFPFAQNLLGSRKGHNIEGINTVKAFLQRYGYLRNNVETNVNVFDENLELALKTYQKFFKLNVSGILDANTLEEMSKPRCGVPDVFNNKVSVTESGEDGVDHHAVGTLYEYFPGKTKWPNTKYNLKYAFHNYFPSYFKNPVNVAITTWSMSTKFAFKEVGQDEEHDIKISFELGDHGDGAPFNSSILAHAFEPDDGRLHFNAAMNWIDGAYEGAYDVYSVTLHEMGHILGLGHSESRHAIMYPTMDSNTIKYLDNDDVDGLWDLYHGWTDA